jgi:hypothetical protein
MNNKQLAEMVKSLCKKKLEEQDPKAETSAYLKKQKFKPEHIPDSSNKNDNTSPNDYKHRMTEELPFRQQGVGARHNPRVTIGNVSKLPSDRSKYQAHGNQSMKNRQESTETDLGSTDTGKKGKESETVSVNPTDNTASATGSMNKNTSTKEIKEKKNATMG